MEGTHSNHSNQLIYSCCCKVLKFRVICYTAIEKEYNLHIVISKGCCDFWAAFDTVDLSLSETLFLLIPRPAFFYLPNPSFSFLCQFFLLYSHFSDELFKVQSPSCLFNLISFSVLTQPLSKYAVDSFFIQPRPLPRTLHLHMKLFAQRYPSSPPKHVSPYSENKSSFPQTWFSFCVFYFSE